LAARASVWKQSADTDLNFRRLVDNGHLPSGNLLHFDLSINPPMYWVDPAIIGLSFIGSLSLSDSHSACPHRKSKRKWMALLFRHAIGMRPTDGR